MLIPDMPNVPPQNVPVMIAQASQTQKQASERTIGVCQPIENIPESKTSAINSVSPVGAAWDYLIEIAHKRMDETILASAKVTMLLGPTHGILQDDVSGSYMYISSNYQYEGTDSATMLVEVGAYKVKVIYRFVLMKNVPGSGDEGTATDDKRICPNGYKWKISSALDANGNSALTSVEYQPSPIAYNILLANAQSVLEQGQTNLFSPEEE